MGSDALIFMLSGSLLNFNPRSPCGERRLMAWMPVQLIRFQSTLPVWGATRRAPKHQFKKIISIHAPRVGSDHRQQQYHQRQQRFQSTLPVWGATGRRRITIAGNLNFNPRSPCGERPLLSLVCLSVSTFQSTLPVWGATQCHCSVLHVLDISIHAPRVGSDV